jgi:predicted enzyme related to lactoylglutathione lyase
MDLLVNIDVPDLEGGVAFYTAAFGLEVSRRNGGGAAELSGLPAKIYLLENPDGSRAAGSGAERSYARHWTPVHLDVVVDDVQSACARAIAAGAVLERPIRTAAWGAIAGLADPFGNGFCLLQFHGRGYDEIAAPVVPA